MNSLQSRRVTGIFFVAGSLMLWGGWMLLPHKVGVFFREEDFNAIYAHWRLWLWLFRVHMFGFVTVVMAFAALATSFNAKASAVLAWPGVFVACAGLIVGTIGAAFYYHFGVWGAQQFQGESAIKPTLDGLFLMTEYVTCLTRFSRVFFGLGLAVICWACLAEKLLPRWLTVIGLALGVTAMALTMGLPDRLSLYEPVFHLNAFWLFSTGVLFLKRGA